MYLISVTSQEWLFTNKHTADCKVGATLDLCTAVVQERGFLRGLLPQKLNSQLAGSIGSELRQIGVVCVSVRMT